MIKMDWYLNSYSVIVMSFYFVAVFGCSMGGILWGTISYRLLVILDLRNAFKLDLIISYLYLKNLCLEFFDRFYHYA
jgi:hypothetical protein